MWRKVHFLFVSESDGMINTMPQWGNKPQSLTFQESISPLEHQGSITFTPLGKVYPHTFDQTNNRLMNPVIG